MSGPRTDARDIEQTSLVVDGGGVARVWGRVGTEGLRNAVANGVQERAPVRIWRSGACLLSPKPDTYTICRLQMMNAFPKQ